MLRGTLVLPTLNPWSPHTVFFTIQLTQQVPQGYIMYFSKKEICSNVKMHLN